MRKKTKEMAAKPKRTSRRASESGKASGKARSGEVANEKQQREGQPFPVVGIGASAGGLEEFRELLAHLPVDTGMALVFVQHLDPKHESMLAELLARSTKLPVSEVEHDVRVAPNHIYVIPPNREMAISGGVVQLR